MCGITGIVSLSGAPISQLERKLRLMNEIIAHRGPDDEGVWCAPDGSAGFGHRRLSIIDLSPAAAQPMKGENGLVITHNGEIYNYIELRELLRGSWAFHSTSDTETVLAAYAKYGDDCLSRLRGMFSFAIWDKTQRTLFAARDRLGIKPFYYAVVGDTLYFASEPKAILPFLPEIETDPAALAQYLTFQYAINDRTLFKGIKQLLPGHSLNLRNGGIHIQRYWDIERETDQDHAPHYFVDRLKELLQDSVELHLRADVPVGAYLSGGIDSSLIAILSARQSDHNREFFHGKFSGMPGYDESAYALLAAQAAGGQLHQTDITARDFCDNIANVIYHLDYPVAGPGSFPQYMVSKMAGDRLKVVLGGQGGDEVFGGYARYLIACLEQCLEAAIDGTSRTSQTGLALESIIPHLGVLKEYKPLIRQFWQEGVFGELHDRYFRLIDRSHDMGDEVAWEGLDRASVYELYCTAFNTGENARALSCFDRMTRFDLKHMLPSLLHVEDRMSMAHGLESRIPLLDHPVVEFAASIPAKVRFDGGRMKHLLKTAYADELPERILARRDKMGFPVPLKEWFDGELKSFLFDLFSSQAAKSRPYLNNDRILANLSSEARFSRKTWALLSLELWHQLFHDRAGEWRARLP